MSREVSPLSVSSINGVRVWIDKISVEESTETEFMCGTRQVFELLQRWWSCMNDFFDLNIRVSMLLSRACKGVMGVLQIEMYNLPNLSLAWLTLKDCPQMASSIRNTWRRWFASDFLSLYDSKAGTAL